ncbi:MAG: hypothetical protein ACYDC1_04085 [Limisphaerales bacterium]
MMGPLSLSALPRPRRMKRPDVAMVCAFLLAACAVAAAVENADPAAQRSLVRFAFSKSLFSEVNENDARAAVKVYSEILADENGVTTGGGPLVLEGTNTMAEALRLNEVDLLSVTAVEFFALESSGLTSPLLLTSVKNLFTEEYVVLVREASNLRKMELHPLTVLDSARALVAEQARLRAAALARAKTEVTGPPANL